MSSWWLCKLDVGKPRDTALVDYLELEFKLLAIKRTIVCEPQVYQYNIDIFKVSVHKSG